MIIGLRRAQDIPMLPVFLWNKRVKQQEFSALSNRNNDVHKLMLQRTGECNKRKADTGKVISKT